jgi:hypothetical protein
MRGSVTNELQLLLWWIRLRDRQLRHGHQQCTILLLEPGHRVCVWFFWNLL